MQFLPMASSPDGLISARYAVIAKTPGWEVLTTTGGGGGGYSKWMSPSSTVPTTVARTCTPLEQVKNT